MTKAAENTLGGYEVLELLGQGGMGAVYKARQPVLDRLVALKVISAKVASDEDYIARFQQEARAAAQLNHPGIVQVYAAGEEDGSHFMVSEFVDGESLQQRLDREGRLEPEQAVVICLHLAGALDYAWREARLIHRDIKPANIFLSNKGTVKLGDLGLAKSVGGKGSAALTLGGMMVGTPHYCSPEQAQAAKDIDFRADIYSLGCTLYHMLSGQMPYPSGPDESAMATMVKHIVQPVPAIQEALPDCPTPLVHVLNKMLAKSPTERHQSYQDLIAELTLVHSQITHPGAELPAAPVTTSNAQPNKKSFTSVAVAASFVLLLAAGLLLWAPWKQSEAAASSVSTPAKSSAQAATQQKQVATTDAPASEPFPTPSKGAATVTQAGMTETVSSPVPSTSEPASEPSSAKPNIVSTPSSQPVASTTLASSAAAPSPPEPTRSAAEPVVTADEALVKEIATLPPEQQVARVTAKLKALNPNFDGKETHKIEGGALTELSFSTAGVADISPLRALKWLKKLVIVPAQLNQKGAVSDLSPLQGLPLTWLWCHGNPITDLSPLRGMPLTVLSCGGTQVQDLTPLAGMKLTVLSFNDTEVSAIAPLEGMPLTVLWCNNTRLTDLSLLKTMPLLELKCDFIANRDAIILNDIKTLRRINDMTAASFWKRVGPITAPLVAATRPAGLPSTWTYEDRLVDVATPKGIKSKKINYYSNSLHMRLVWVPAGEFLMGSPTTEAGRKTDETQHPVRIPKPFFMGVCEVTNDEWQTVMGGKPMGRGFLPHNFTPWREAIDFCKRLSAKEGVKYRLPTEAEWEYACRAGTTTPYYFGDNLSNGDAKFPTTDGAGFSSTRGGSYPPNEFGLFDMHGNLWEWCQSLYKPYPYNASDGRENLTSSAPRVLRGSTSDGTPETMRSAARCGRKGDQGDGSLVIAGFRVVCELTP